MSLPGVPVLFASADAKKATYDKAVEALLAYARTTQDGLPLAACALYLSRAESLHAVLPALASSTLCRALVTQRVWTLTAESAADKATAARPPKATAVSLAQVTENLALAGLPLAAAAMELFHGQPASALARYQQVLVAHRTELPPYAQALLHLQIATLLHRLQAREPVSEVLRHALLAKHLLAQLADEAETAGQPERAVDIYCIYLALGRALGRIEDLTEGFVGCLRILRAEGLRASMARAYEDFIADCERLGEHVLAAEQCQEAADSLDDPTDALPLRRRAAQQLVLGAAATDLPLATRQSLLKQAARLLLLTQQPHAASDVLATLCEILDPTHATLARRLADLSKRLSKEPTSSSLGSSPTDAQAGNPPPLASPQAALPPVWDTDLLDLERGPDAVTVCLSLLGNPSLPALVRRHALRVCLFARYGSDATHADIPGDYRLPLLDSLTALRTYEILTCLEWLYSALRQGDPQVFATTNGWVLGRLWGDAPARATPPLLLVDREALRTVLVRGLARLPFRRTLALVQAALSDPAASVQAAAQEVIAELSFPAAVGPLCRWLAASSGHSMPVRRAALSALARQSDPRALDALLSTLLCEREPLSSDAKRLLAYVLQQPDSTLRRTFQARLATMPTPLDPRLTALTNAIG